MFEKHEKDKSSNFAAPASASCRCLNSKRAMVVWNVILSAVLAVAAFAGTAGAQEARSLAGQWRFLLDAEKQGVNQAWYAGPLAEGTTIKLPGTMDDAGLGPKNTKPPTLEGPYRLYDYAGPAWYQRDIEIPAGWSGKRVTLFLERCRWVTQVWLDDRRIGTRDSLIAPQVYDFGTAVTPGRHRLTICVDNTMKLNLGGFVSVLRGGTPGNMNGIIGRIELKATPSVWIDDVRVYPDVDHQVARVTVKIGNATGRPGYGTLVVGETNARATWDANGGQVEVEVDMRGAKLWDEFSPNLQALTVKLGKDHQVVSFGMRKFAIKGTQFTLNDRPVFLRGTVDSSAWPLTGYPPTDVPAWRRICSILKAYGLNFIRFHSWCPPEAAFVAADQTGIFFQIEGPQANAAVGEIPERDAFIKAELQRIVDSYGNHPSFCTMTLGNEYGGDDKILSQMVDSLIKNDSRHLYSSASMGQNTTNRQFTETQNGRGVDGPGTEHDLSGIVADDPHPIVGHEIGQWAFFPNFDETKKWTGVMRLNNYDLVRERMKTNQILDLAKQFEEACGRFSVLLYKEEVESLRRTPGYAGFSVLDIHDYPTQGTAIVGLLDAFWDSKGFVTPEAYRRFGGPTVPLLRIPRRTYTTNESFSARVDVSHFGPADLANVQPVWTIKDGHGREVASGELPALTVPTGKLTTLGTINAPLVKAQAPCKLTVTVSLGKFSNDWEIWAYPPGKAVAPGRTMISYAWDEAAQKALADGKNVLLFPKTANIARKLPGKFLPIFWSPVWFPTQKPNTHSILCDPKNPLFAQFPTEFYSNWQWWNILNNSYTLMLPTGFQPLVRVIDNFVRDKNLGNLFEAQVGNGKLLVCTLDLPSLGDKYPEANQLLKSIYAYVGSSAFHPKQKLDLAVLDDLFVSKPLNVERLRAKVHADSEEPGYGVALAMDNDPVTFWHSQWTPKAALLPHEFVLEFPEVVVLTGFTYLPRQDMSNGRIGEYEVYAGSLRITSGKWPNYSDALETVRFPKPVKTRNLRIVFKSELNGGSFASVAEFDVTTLGDGTNSVVTQKTADIIESNGSERTN